MARLGSYQELTRLYENVKPLLITRLLPKPVADVKKEILVCGDTGCQASDSQKVVDNLNAQIEQKGLQEDNSN